MSTTQQGGPILMVQGTGSSVGKSLLVTALCRIYSRRGLKVAPFKAQNMALNAHVTLDGLEMGRAQAVQAQAAGIEPQVRMNPVLLKPEGNRRSQVIVMGRSQGTLDAQAYQAHKNQLKPLIAQCLAELRASHDLVLIEGAGSPAEINLRADDIVNMHVALLARAPVLLAADIDRGGVFAALVGTLELLAPAERQRVAGFVINKFRGDLALLQPGLDFLQQRTGLPVLGVVPHLGRLHLPEEDSAGLELRGSNARAPRQHLEVAVLRYPRLANFDDLGPLEHEAEVTVRYVTQPHELHGADLVVLPGSKATLADLAWLRQQGFAEVLTHRAQAGLPILGICGGCQMLGEHIADLQQVESPHTEAWGLGLLPLTTHFFAEKRTRQVEAQVLHPNFLTPAENTATPLKGYWLHAGQTRLSPGALAPLAIRQVAGQPQPAGPSDANTQMTDGALSANGAVVGTMLHGLLENDSVRQGLLAHLRRLRALPHPQHARPVPNPAQVFDQLADAVEQALNMTQLDRIIGLEHP